MKKALSILLAMGMTVGMVAGCGDTADNSSAADNSAAASTEAGTDGTQAAASAAVWQLHFYLGRILWLVL